MKALTIALVFLTVLGAFPSAVSAEQRIFIVDAEFYRVRDSIVEARLYEVRAQVSVPDRIGLGLFRKRSQPEQKTLIFFEGGNLTLGNVELKADERSWTWNGQDKLPKGKGIELISHPRVVSTPGEPFVVKTTSDAAIDYLEKRPDGLFELKRSNVPLGIRFEGRIDEGDSGRLVELNLTIMANFVVKRRPIEGVTLDVGAPIVEEHETAVTLKPGRYYGLFLPTEGKGGLIIRLRVDPQNET